MRLLIDAGNTRLKWQLVRGETCLARGGGDLAGADLFQGASPHLGALTRVAVSTVASETACETLAARLKALTPAPVSWYWTEPARGGLTCAYEQPHTMGADRWHGLYAAWRRYGEAVAVLDAGSALTVDLVDAGGQHLGGYILPGRGMMLRSLRQDAARIGFADSHAGSLLPGRSTTECVHHGLHWLWQGLVSRVEADCERLAIGRVLLTGGDAPELQALGLKAELRPDLVFEGLAAIDAESHP
ncbi:MAG: type III pantothenate kinase [Marinobacter sp.]|uniref:type III pantothenate kinase n=1 Tax=Marinobacter sp. TaxID=50741 RepID=UPI00299E1A15|nr:type III pantothenate kinase [Marinobacter sp.]MDX1635854.1 type III pantothenate kinase [Marinobacter sp.]